MKKGDGAFTHWRDSARIPRFFFVDARASLPVFLAFLRPHFWTFGLALGFIVFLTVLDYFKIPLTVSLRIARGWLGGKVKHRITRR